MHPCRASSSGWWHYFRQRAPSPGGRSKSALLMCRYGFLALPRSSPAAWRCGRSDCAGSDRLTGDIRGTLIRGHWYKSPLPYAVTLR
jgi:hypothetical protein